MRIAIALVALLLAASCGGAKTPTQPAPVPAPNIRSQGSMSFSGCNTFGGCFYEGEARNAGPGCAVNVRGVSRLFNDAGTETARSDWSLAATRRINPGETFLYSGCCFALTAVDTPGTYRTDFSYDTVRC